MSPKNGGECSENSKLTMFKLKLELTKPQLSKDKLDWAAKLGLGPLAGGEVPVPPGAEVPRNVRDAMAQKTKAEEMAELRRRIVPGSTVMECYGCYMTKC